MELEKILADKGYTKQSHIDAIIDKLRVDGVRLSDFNKDQRKRIIISYGAALLA